MTGLNVFYCVLGAVFVVLGIACILEKYRTVRGAALLPARITACSKKGASAHRSAGGYHFEVEFGTPDGASHTAATNDAFWFGKEKQVGNIIDVYYNEKSPKTVERKSFGAEVLSAVFVLLGLVLIFALGLPL